METLTGLDREPGSALPLLRQLRFDTGSPALNLLSTVGRRRSGAPIERMGTQGRLRDWLAGNGLAGVPVGPGELSAATELREAAYQVLTGHGTEADVAVVDRWSSRATPGPGLRRRPDGALALEPPPASFESLMSLLARDIAELAARPPEQLRLCDFDECGTLYLDTSRGRRRRWCSMGRCGNVAKVTRFRATREESS
ncbi:MAG TPA: CGNR zinc finger domain-containing protein [Trebonia sp.]